MSIESDYKVNKKASPLARTDPLGGRILIWLGALGSAGYIFLIFRYFGKWSSLTVLEPDKFGSFVGRAVGPLALFWLVLGFFQQGVELRHSSRALWLQSEELRNSVKQQEALVAVAREQIAHERSEREHAQREVKRLAQPIFGVQSNGGQNSGGLREFGFLIANAGATCMNVRLFEGEQSFGEAATLTAGAGVSVNFRFEPGELVRERSLRLTYTDGLGAAGEALFQFPVVEKNGVMLLVGPPASGSASKPS